MARRLLGLVADREYGLFPAAPVMLAALLAAGRFLRAFRLMGVGTVATTAAVLVMSSFWVWWGGASAPARFLAVALPAQALWLAFLWSRAGRPARRVLSIALGLTAAITALYASLDDGARVATFPDGRGSILRGALALRRRRPGPAVLVPSRRTDTARRWCWRCVDRDDRSRIVDGCQTARHPRRRHRHRNRRPADPRGGRPRRRPWVAHCRGPRRGRRRQRAGRATRGARTPGWSAWAPARGGPAPSTSCQRRPARHTRVDSDPRADAAPRAQPAGRPLPDSRPATLDGRRCPPRRARA